MYNSQIVAKRIKKAVKDKGTSMEVLNSECNLSKNAISAASKSSEGMKAKNLYLIAEYLDISIDYLLGRTDNPKSHKCTFTVSGNQQSNVTGDNNISISASRDSPDDELLALINGLSIVEKSKIIVMIDEMKNGK